MMPKTFYKLVRDKLVEVNGSDYIKNVSVNGTNILEGTALDNENRINLNRKALVRFLNTRCKILFVLYRVKKTEYKLSMYSRLFIQNQIRKTTDSKLLLTFRNLPANVYIDSHRGTDTTKVTLNLSEESKEPKEVKITISDNDKHKNYKEFTKLEMACILLQTPNSGRKWLDNLIKSL